MSTTHTIEAGDWIGAIAERFGFPHWSALWEHPVNAPIRELRGSPDLLMVGDELQIPDAEDDVPGISVQSGRRAVFRLRGDDRLRIRIPGASLFAEAFGPLPFELKVGDETPVTGELTADGDDIIEAPLPTSATKAVLTLRGRTMEFSVGGLGPAAEAHGARTRLLNLGFDAQADEPPPETALPSDPPGLFPPPAPVGVADPLAVGLRAFQHRHGLPTTGELDEATAKALDHEYSGDK